MRKTLLIAGAALAASIISSQAQTVYSQNVVGYINQTIPAGKFQLVCNQLLGGSDTAQTNCDVNVTLVNGLISSPNNPGTSSNSTMLYYNGSGFITYTYYNSADATVWEDDAPNVYPAGWYTAGGVPAPVNLVDGKSVFIHNNASVDLTVTTVGTVKQGTNVSVIQPGYNLIGLQVPISTNAVVDGSGNPLPYGLPLNLTSSSSAPSAGLNDQMLYWNGNGYITYTYYNSADATVWEDDAPNVYPAGFYTAGGVPGNFPGVNQGFFIKHIGTAINWTNSFTVQ